MRLPKLIGEFQDEAGADLEVEEGEAEEYVEEEEVTEEFEGENEREQGEDDDYKYEPYSLTATRANLPISSGADRLCRSQTGGADAEALPRYDKRFKYDTCATNLTHFPSLEYTQCEAMPYCARLNPVERGGNARIEGEEEEVLACEGDNKFGSSKANVCMKGGSWYFEVTVLKPGVRMGIARREASCEGIVGSNAYSYAIDAEHGSIVHCGRHTDFMRPLEVGDTVGFHVFLPIDSLPGKVNRTRIPVRVGGQLWFESLNYRTTHDMLMWESEVELPPVPAEELIAGSYCAVYRNNERVGTLAAPLRDFRPPHSQYVSLLNLPPNDDGMLGYFPMISVYNNGVAKLNCGPDFKGTMPEGAKPLCERYDEQIADDFTLDLLGEVLFEEIDRLVPHIPRRKLREFKQKEPKATAFGAVDE